MPLRQWQTPEHLLVYPPQQCPVQFDQLLPWHVGQHRLSLSLDHQVPHWWNRGLSPALIAELRLIGDKMKFPTPMVEAALLDFMAAHGTLTGGIQAKADSGVHAAIRRGARHAAEM